MATARIDVIITAKDRASSVLKKVGKNAEGFGRSLDRTVKRGAIAAGVAITGLGIFAVKAAGDYEQSRISFETMLGSAEKAGELLSKIAEFAARTPFSLPEVVTGAKRLLAFGIEADKILPTLKSLGDVSAGLGVPMERLILNFGQVKSQAKLTGRELRDFAIAGVPLIAELAKNLGVSEAAITDMVSAGQIGFPEVEAAFKSMTGEGGKFQDLMDKQSESLNGIISNLKDNFIRLALEILGISAEGVIEEDGLFAQIKRSAEIALKFLDENKAEIAQTIQNIANAIINFGKTAIKWIEKLREVWNTTFGKILIGAIIVAVAVIAAAGGSIFAIMGLVIGVVLLVAEAFRGLANVVKTVVFNMKSKWLRFKLDFSLAVNKVKGFIGSLIDKFKSIPGAVRAALSGVGDAIKAPFKSVFKWLDDKTEIAKGLLNRLNPFSRQSPSLVDNVRAGSKVIKQEFGSLFKDIGVGAGNFNLPGAGNTDNSRTQNLTISIAGGINNTGGLTVQEIVQQIARQLELSRQGGF